MTNSTQAQQIDLKAQHLEAGLDPEDLQHLDSSSATYRKSTMVKRGQHFVFID